MSKIKADALSTLAGAEVPMATVVSGSAKAWVNFNGTGTVAIRAAFNVTSITDNGVGDYSINFTAPMPTTSYCPVGFCSYTSGGGTYGFGPREADVPFGISSLRVLAHYGGAAADVIFAGVACYV